MLPKSSDARIIEGCRFETKICLPERHRNFLIDCFPSITPRKANRAEPSGAALSLSIHRVPTFFRPGILPTQESDGAGIGTPQADVTRFRVDF